MRIVNRDGEYILAGVFVKIQSLVVSDVVFAKKFHNSIVFFKIVGLKAVLIF